MPVYPQQYPQVVLPQTLPKAVAAAPVPAPKVRMLAPDEPRPGSKLTTVNSPSPEQLGLAAANPSGVDWDATRTRLRQMKAACFLLDRLPAGGYRFTCWLPASQAGKSYRIEADGIGQAEAVQLCLERADRWIRQSP